MQYKCLLCNIVVVCICVHACVRACVCVCVCVCVVYFQERNKKHSFFTKYIYIEKENKKVLNEKKSSLGLDLYDLKIRV